MGVGERGGIVDALAAKLGSTIDFTLKPELLPQGFKGGLRLDVAQARGGFTDAAGLATTLDLDLTMTDIKQLALKVARGAQQLATISAVRRCPTRRRRSPRFRCSTLAFAAVHCR